MRPCHSGSEGMKPRHQVSRAAIELVKRFEGYRQRAAQLPDGRWTIGYGHTLSARQGAQVSEADAEALLLYDLMAVARTVDAETFAALDQNQFDALCAFAFSIGLDAFRRSAVLKRVNEGAFAQAAFAMELWRKAEFEGERIVVDALLRRRAAEKLLFLTPASGIWPLAPSALLKPLLDVDGLDAAPRQDPAPMVPETEGEQLRIRREARPAAEPAAPAAEAEPGSPLKAAAEAVTARLQALFPEPEPALQPEPGPAAPPIGTGLGVAPEADAPEMVTSETELAAGETAEAAAPEPLVELEPVAEGLSLGAPPSAGPRIDAAAPAESFARTPANDMAAGESGTAASERRVLIDDTAPYEYVPPPVQPLPPQPVEGALTVVFLAVLGLAFFGGGVFWALAAQPAPSGALLGPLVVGWLAGIAGVAFITAAVFMFLQRIGRAAGRRRDDLRS